MKCKKCGKELKPGVKFCGFCGAPVEPEKSIDKKKNKKVWVLGAGGVLLAASIVGIVASGVLVKKPGAEKKEAVTEEQNLADGGNKEEKETETIYLPSKTTAYDADGNATEYTVCVYQQNEDGITGEEITYPADEGREAWSKKKNIKYDKYGREEWEYVFQIEDGVETLYWIRTYEYESDGSYYQRNRSVFLGFDSVYTYHLDRDGKTLTSEEVYYYEDESSSGFMDDSERRTENIYDQEGNILLSKVYDENGNLESTEEYNYDENGRVISTQSYDFKNKIIGRTEYSYKNSENLEYTVISYDENNIICGRREYVNSDDGKESKFFDYSIEDGTETLVSGTEATYDDEGNMVAYTESYDSSVENTRKRTDYKCEYQDFEVAVVQDRPQKSIERQEEQNNNANGIYLPVKFMNFSADGFKAIWDEYSYEKKMDKLSGQEKCILKIQMETRNV